MIDFAGMRLEALGEPGEAMAGIAGLLGVDTEDWYQIMLRNFGRGPRCCRVQFRRGLAAILEVLARHGCKATFFVLGMTAAEDPSLVGDLAAAGHDIATHGFGHVHLEKISPEEFDADLARAIGELTKLTGKPVLGHRAPEFSVPRRDPAGFFRTLLARGIRYDSSVFPMPGRRYGIAGFPRTPTRVHVGPGGGNGSIVEFPVVTSAFMGKLLPVAGGGYWRLLPRWLLLRLLARARRQGVLMTLYLHNYEFDPQKLDLAGVAPVEEFSAGWNSFQRKQNMFRESMPGKLDRLLGRFRFACFRDYLASAESARSDAARRV